MVTGQTWQSHPEFYRMVFECLGAPEKVEEVEKVEKVEK
jgi:hypothetical protein